MISKKIKQKVGIVCAVAGLFAGSMTTFAASYVQSNMPGYSSISCWGSLGFSGQTMTATTSSNGSNMGGYKTSITGKLARNGASLGSQSSSGTTKASITNSRANGYISGAGTHNAYYRNSTWSGNTSI